MTPDNILHIILLLLAIGTVGGFLSGLLGVGGGIIFVPSLYFCLTSFGVDTDHAIKLSVGTSLALVLATSCSSTYWQSKKGALEMSIVKSWWWAMVAGVALGTCFASSVDGHFMKQLFAVVMIFIAIYMAVSKEPKTEETAPRISKAKQRLVAGMIGTLSSLIGVGGAVMNVPFMAYIGVPIRKAVGTGGALGMVISLPAMICYIISGWPHNAELPAYSMGYVNMVAVAVIIPVTLLLSPVGVHVSHKVPKQMLRRIFAGVLVLVSLRMFMSA